MYYLALDLATQLCPQLESRMRSLILATYLLSFGLAQDLPRYACPEVDVNFHNFNILNPPITNVASWEDCGRYIIS